MKNKLKFRWLKEIDDLEKQIEVKNFNSSYLIKIQKKLEIFDLGFLILNMCLMGIFDEFLMNYECFHENNKKENCRCCCLYHCIIKYEKASVRDKKIKITNFVNDSRFSKSFMEFLCFTLSYKNDLNFSYYIVKDHKWLKDEDKNLLSENSSVENLILLELEEIIKVSREIKFRKELKKFELIKRNLLLNNSNDDFKLSENFEKIIVNNFCEKIFKILLKFHQENFNKIQSVDQIFNQSRNNEEIENIFHEIAMDLKITNQENFKLKIYDAYNKIFN